MITHITETEQRLTNTLRTCTEALQAVTAERDDLSKLLHQALDERDHYVKARDALKADAALCRVAMRFVDRSGDYCDIDPAERICDEFYKAMADQITANCDAAMKGTS